jgi:multicomponent Na+:H+ antiporter subunit A
MLMILLIGLFITFCSPVVHQVLKQRAGVVLSLFPTAFFIYCCTFLPAVTSGETIIIQYAWVPQLGIDLVFLVDGLSLFFALLISGFGTLITLYASGYLAKHKQLGRFYMYLLLFMIAMLGVVLSGNLISLFVFWELTSLSSFFLISFDHEKTASRAAALQAMLITVGGGLVMLAGFILLGSVTGTFNIPETLTSSVVEHKYYPFIVVLVLVGAFTKSAQFPFHFWLPNAMAAPTPVSAYLHSATMVKAGVFLVARLTPVLGGTTLWQMLLMVTGCITMVLGAVMAMRYTDLKRILAFTTISALGTLFLMLGVGTTYALQAAIIFILAHALYKGALFMVAGNLDHQSGSRDVEKLSGMSRLMPYTAAAAILACLSMSGVIPFLGFISKELVYEAALNATVYNIILVVAVIGANALGTAIAISIGYRIFFGKFISPKQQVKEAPASMWIGPLLIAIAGFLFGFLPQWFVQPMLNIAVVQLMKDIEVMHLSLWHGLNLVLLLSFVTLLLGYLAYRARGRVKTIADKLTVPRTSRPTIIFEKTLKGMLYVSHRITRFTQNGFLRYYIATIVWVFIALVIFVLFTKNMVLHLQPKIFSLLEFRFYEEIICIFIVMGVIKIFYTLSRVTALASMGVVGYGLALIYIIFSAPDTAMTQFLVETLTVVLFVLVLHKLPFFEDISEKKRRFAYLVLSVVFGCVMTYILLLVRSYPMTSELKTYFAENSVPLGQGRNIVNVILVDFRSLDTMGEAVVLGIAAIGIYSLLKLKPAKGDVINKDIV